MHTLRHVLDCTVSLCLLHFKLCHDETKRRVAVDERNSGRILCTRLANRITTTPDKCERVRVPAVDLCVTLAPAVDLCRLECGCCLTLCIIGCERGKLQVTAGDWGSIAAKGAQGNFWVQNGAD